MLITPNGAAPSAEPRFSARTVELALTCAELMPSTLRKVAGATAADVTVIVSFAMYTLENEIVGAEPPFFDA